MKISLIKSYVFKACVGLFILIFTLPFSLKAQELLPSVEVGEMTHQFYDATKEAFIVIADEQTYYIYDEDRGGYEKLPLQFQTDSTFEHLVNEFYPLSTANDGTFFVHRGCGVVYRFIGNKLYRHDKSYYHLNQFGGAIFLVEDEIYMFGGYGLFTYKNILVRYDRNLREWFNVDYIGTPPAPIFYPIVGIHQNKMYYLGGRNKTSEFIQTDIYAFDFESNTWHVLGAPSHEFFQYTKKLFGRLDKTRSSADFLFGEDVFIEMDVEDNIFSVYEFKSKGSIISIQQHPIRSELFQVHIGRSGVKSHFVEVVPKDKLVGAVSDSGTILLPIRQPLLSLNQIYVLLAFVLGMLLTLFIVIVYHKFQKRKKKIHSWDFTNIPFDRDDFGKLRALLLNAADHTIEVSAINELVEEDGLSADAIKKRRERLLKDFTHHLSEQFALPSSEIFIELRHEKDKRIKLLKLNKSLVSKV